MNTELQEFIQVAETAARAAGELLSGALKTDPGILSAEGHDIKTQADRDAEAAVLGFLNPTGIPIVAEESGLHSPDLSRSIRDHLQAPGRLWIVDPLDGTYNYTRGMPFTCVSIGLWENGRAALGVLYDFNVDEMWVGVPGEGATCNGEPVRVSEVSDLAQAVLATGFPGTRDMSDAALRTAVAQYQAYKKVRMIGSAAMAMVYVARGWVDTYMEDSARIWDIAAGAALVEAAGGQVDILNLQSDGRLDIRCGNGRLPLA